MTEPIKIISPTGCVHIAKGQNGNNYLTLCNQTTSLPEFSAFEFTAWHHWPLTFKQVSCRRCLAKSESSAHRLKELAIKASDLDSDFRQLAKKCEFFFLEDKENAQIFHDFQLKFCSHRHRLGTKKNPKECNLLDCPLRYNVVGGNHG
jgi:hypothetical protein